MIHAAPLRPTHGRDLDTSLCDERERKREREGEGSMGKREECKVRGGESGDDIIHEREKEELAKDKGNKARTGRERLG